MSDCTNCPDCDCPECTHNIQLGPAMPVALVCNLIPETDNTDDPLCLQCCGTMCYHEDDIDPNEPGITHEVMLMMNICLDPPVQRYFDMSTGNEIVDQAIIDRLYNCDIDVTEEEVCVTIGDDTSTAIKRTFYASNPVDVFIGPDGIVVNPDSWVPGECHVTLIPSCYEDENGNFFDAITRIGEDGIIIETLIDGIVTDTSLGTVKLAPCDLCCTIPATETHSGLAAGDIDHTILGASGIIEFVNNTYNGDLCDAIDTIALQFPNGFQTVGISGIYQEFTMSAGIQEGQVSVIFSQPSDVRMGFRAFANGVQLLTFAVQRPDRITPGPQSSIPSQVALDALIMPITWDNNDDPDRTFFEWDNITRLDFDVLLGAASPIAFTIAEVSHLATSWAELCDTITRPCSIPAGEKVCYDDGDTKEAFVSFDCDGVPEYRDTLTNEILVGPSLVECPPIEIRPCSVPAGEKVCYDDGGLIKDAFVSFDCDGLPEYRDTLTNGVLVGPSLVECPVEDYELIPLCDVDGGSVTPFLRHFVRGIVTPFEYDTELDGVTPYVVLGIAELCVGAISPALCETVDQFQLCMSDNEDPEHISIWARVVECDGTVYYLSDIGVRFNDIPVGFSIVPCSATSECQLLCDDQGGGTIVPFFRCTCLDEGGNLTISDVELDLDTPYTVLGTVIICSSDPVSIGELEVTDFNIVGGTTTWPSNTIHSLSFTVASGSADINGFTLPEGSHRFVEGSDGLNNIQTAQILDNVTGTVIGISTRFV